MLRLLMALALWQDVPPLPPPPENLQALDYHAVPLHGTAQPLPHPAEGAPADFQLLVVDEHHLRVLLRLHHDSLETVDLAHAGAWQWDDDLRIVLPLADTAASPFAPRCCGARSEVDLLIGPLPRLPERVTVHRQRPQLDVLGEQSLVPEQVEPEP